MFLVLKSVLFQVGYNIYDMSRSTTKSPKNDVRQTNVICDVKSQFIGIIQ